jgi:hypothetical protein
MRSTPTRRIITHARLSIRFPNRTHRFVRIKPRHLRVIFRRQWLRLRDADFAPGVQRFNRNAPRKNHSSWKLAPGTLWPVTILAKFRLLSERNQLARFFGSLGSRSQNFDVWVGSPLRCRRCAWYLFRCILCGLNLFLCAPTHTSFGRYIDYVAIA